MTLENDNQDQELEEKTEAIANRKRFAFFSALWFTGFLLAVLTAGFDKPDTWPVWIQLLVGFVCGVVLMLIEERIDERLQGDDTSIISINALSFLALVGWITVPLLRQHDLFPPVGRKVFEFFTDDLPTTAFALTQRWESWILLFFVLFGLWQFLTSHPKAGEEDSSDLTITDSDSPASVEEEKRPQ